ncbi:MAG: AraC family transcriptional regulator [Burkholderiaceae bacterium]|nr:AraC family transcriptional regulator [Burkholderiaceae bacterium]
MEARSSVGAGFVAGLFEAASRTGVERAALLRQAGLGGGDDAAEQARLPMSAVIALFDAAVVLSGRDDIGLEFARRVRPGTFSVLGYALMTCRTLGEAIEVAPHFRRLVFDIGYSEMRFVQNEEEARLGWHVVSNALPYCRSLAEALIASWYHFGRWMAGVELPLKEVLFRHEAPSDASPYTAFFDCPVRFGASENALVFSSALLTMPLVQADENLHLAMREQARAAMEKAFSQSDLAHRLHQALIPLMPKCEATLEHAASALGLSPRTLQRRLGEASLRFQGVLDAARKDMAVIYLRDPTLSVLDVSLLLGYAEHSSFTRAFRAWFSCNPSAWRRARSVAPD